MTAPYYEDDQITLLHGDCLDVLRQLADASVDAVCTDPPYGLRFMGAAWDGQDIVEATAKRRAQAAMPDDGHSGANGGYRSASTEAGRYDLSANAAFGLWCEAWATECLRVLKPGGHLLAFGGARTWHRLASGIEDAGFEIRDSIAWLFGSGFPKSLDVSKAIDRHLGVERVGTGETRVVPDATKVRPHFARIDASEPGAVREYERTEAGSAAAAAGWGTALKPAFEPIVVARKPLAGTVAANVLTHGTGALNIDGCRIGMQGGEFDRLSAWADKYGGKEYAESGVASGKGLGAVQPPNPGGRWPANVVLDESQAVVLDEQSGDLNSGTMRAGTERQPRAGGTIYGADSRNFVPADTYGDSGGASRFFYVAREDNDPCHSTSAASTVDSLSSRPSEPDDSAPSGAATSASRATDRPTDSPSTSGTPNASRPSESHGTQPTRTTADAPSPEQRPDAHTPTRNPANAAAPNQPTDITTTTTSRPTSAGCAVPATSSTTPTSVPGVPLDELGSRFTYVAKADSSERPRVGGVAHPTVKPLELMRWLVRLVTPPGGVVLEPFAGSGTTVEACLLEGFKVVAIEREADYLPLIEARIARRRDPVRAIELASDDAGLFGLLEGETA